MLSKNGVGHKCAPTARLNRLSQCTELLPLFVDLPIRTAVAIFFETYARHLKNPICLIHNSMPRCVPGISAWACFT